MSAEAPDHETWGRLAYEGYASSTGWRTYDSRQMPAWADLGEPIQAAWDAAAQGVRFATQMRITRELPEPAGQPAAAHQATDPTTQRMRDETGHDCIACPTRVRDVMATAHNALGQWDAVQSGSGDTARLARKMGQLRQSAALMEEIAAGHFAALEAWRRP